MTMYISKSGHVKSKIEWEKELDKFWGIFDRMASCQDIANKMPRRPTNAWERYSRVMGLEVVE